MWESKIQFTTLASVSIILYCGTLTFGFEEPLPVAFIGVAQVAVLHDDHVSIADLFEGAEAQVADVELSHDHATDSTNKGKQSGTGRESKREHF